MLKNGLIREPRWSAGDKLLALHRSYVNGGFIHDRSTTAQLGAVLAGGVPQTGDGEPRGAIQATQRGGD